mmetsp:Transcript_7408/g.18421  ORF Transcript_7408/g.18421 Transcript_7408/m.18421 type:complete len:240 (-) Transcript_7408:68-787(-)
MERPKRVQLACVAALRLLRASYPGCRRHRRAISVQDLLLPLQSRFVRQLEAHGARALLRCGFRRQHCWRCAHELGDAAEGRQCGYLLPRLETSADQSGGPLVHRAWGHVPRLGSRVVDTSCRGVALLLQGHAVLAPLLRREGFEACNEFREVLRLASRRAGLDGLARNHVSDRVRVGVRDHIRILVGHPHRLGPRMAGRGCPQIQPHQQRSDRGDEWQLPFSRFCYCRKTAPQVQPEGL